MAATSAELSSHHRQHFHSPSSSSLADPSLSPKEVIVFSLDVDGALLTSLTSRLILEYAGADIPLPDCKDYRTFTQLPYRSDYATLSEEIKEKLKVATKKALEHAHQVLIAHILKQIPDVAQVYFLSGSNRQTRRRDFTNGDKGTGSSFIALEAFKDIIQEKLGERARAKVTLDTMLLEDLALKQPCGTYFNDALTQGRMLLPTDPNQLSKLDLSDRDKLIDNDERTEFDESKRMLLYTQMHHIASKYPELPITFHFYDDDPLGSFERQILGVLQIFFSHQVVDGVRTFLDTQIDDMSIQVKNRLHLLQHRYRKMPMQTDSQAGTTPISRIENELQIFKKAMITAIIQLSDNLQKFQSQDPESLAIPDILSTFQTLQTTAMTNLTNALASLKQTYPLEEEIYADPNLVDATFDILKNVLMFLKVALHITPEEPDEYKGMTREEIQAKLGEVLLTTPSQPRDAVPQNVTLSLHRYVGPKINEDNESVATSELRQTEPLLVDKTLIQGTGPIDTHYDNNYYEINQRLFREDFGRYPRAGQEKIFNQVMPIWKDAVSEHQPLNRDIIDEKMKKLASASSQQPAELTPAQPAIEEVPHRSNSRISRLRRHASKTIKGLAFHGSKEEKNRSREEKKGGSAIGPRR